MISKPSRRIGLFLLLCSTLAFGSPVHVRHLGGPEGLKDLLVNVIHRDSSGLVWLGTGSSVELFDGIRLTHFPLPGNNDFSQRVTAIVGQSDKQLYVGNGNGLYSLSAPTNQPIAQAQWLAIGENQIVGAISDLYLHNETLYVATDHGLYTCDMSGALDTRHLTPDTKHYPLHPNDLNSANQLRHLCMDKDGVLWMTSPVGLHALLPNRQITHYLYPDLPEGGFSSICYVQDTLLLGTFHNGIYYFSIPNATYGLLKPGVQPISALQAINNDSLLIATDGGGVQMINRHNLQPLPLNCEPFTSNNVYSMLYDQEGLLWVGYYQQGLDYTIHQDRTIQVYQTPTWDSYGKAVRAFATHGDWKMIGTRDGLYMINEQTGKVRTFSEKELNAQMIFAICAYRQRFYIGTFGGGLYSLSSTSQPQLVHEQVGSQIFCLTPDTTGLLWVGSEKGVYALEGNKIVHQFDASNSRLPKGNVYAIFFDRLGRGWFCTQSGMAIYDAEQHTIRTDIFPNAFPHQQAVRSVYQDSEGTLFFLPDKGHVFACNEHLRMLPMNLPDVEGLFITKDAQGRLWLGTTNGLYCFAHANSELTLQNYYDFSSGLPDNIFTLCQPYWDKDSTLWMGHSRGLVSLPPSLPLYSPTPQVIDVQQQGGNVTFLFSDLRFTLPQYTHYTYGLKGFEIDEHTLDGYSQCSYSGLPMGKYTFVLRNSYRPNSQSVYLLRVPMSRLDAFIIVTAILIAIIFVLLALYLHHRKRYHPKADRQIGGKAERTTSYRTFHMSTQELKALSARFSQAVEQNKTYLNPTLRIADVAAKIEVSSYSLSYMLNQYLHTNFNDYINKLRIDYFCQRVKKGDAKRFSIDTLSQECGFVSRAGFFRNFKKIMGKTPNEYIQSIKTTNH